MTVPMRRDPFQPSMAHVWRSLRLAVTPYSGQLASETPTRLRATAANLRAVADYFEAHPERFVRGALRRGEQVCTVGLLRANSRKQAGITDFVHPTRSHLANEIDSMLVDINDTGGMTAKRIVKVHRAIADLLDWYAGLPKDQRTIDAWERTATKNFARRAKKAEFNTIKFNTINKKDFVNV